MKVKFLNCLTVTCFFIAAKLEEDIEVRGSCYHRMIHMSLAECTIAAPGGEGEWVWLQLCRYSEDGIDSHAEIRF